MSSSSAPLRSISHPIKIAEPAAIQDSEQASLPSQFERSIFAFSRVSPWLLLFDYIPIRLPLTEWCTRRELMTLFRDRINTCDSLGQSVWFLYSSWAALTVPSREFIIRNPSYWWGAHDTSLRFWKSYRSLLLRGLNSQEIFDTAISDGFREILWAVHALSRANISRFSVGAENIAFLLS